MPREIDLDGDGLNLREELQAVLQRSKGRLDEDEKKGLREKAMVVGLDLLMYAATGDLALAKKAGSGAMAWAADLFRDLAD